MLEEKYEWINSKVKDIISYLKGIDNDIKEGKKLYAVGKLCLVAFLMIIIAAIICFSMWILFSPLGIFMKIVAGILITMTLIILGFFIYVIYETSLKKAK